MASWSEMHDHIVESFGGEYAREYAWKLPDSIQDVVLTDPPLHNIYVQCECCGETALVGVSDYYTDHYGGTVVLKPRQELVSWEYLERYVPNIRSMVENKRRLSREQEEAEEDG